MPSTIATEIKLEAQTGIKSAPGSLLDAIHRRHTSRSFSPAPLSERHLSQLLWSAYGINRADGHRTVPAAMGIYALRIYAVMPEGIFLYVPAIDSLSEIVSGDYRGMAGTQDFVADAPLNLVIFADYNDYRTGDPEADAIMQGHEAMMSALDAGAATENAYLYCSSEGINAVERMMIDEAAFRRVAGLPESEHFQVAMTVGYPA